MKFQTENVPTRTL